MSLKCKPASEPLHMHGPGPAGDDALDAMEDAHGTVQKSMSLKYEDAHGTINLHISIH